MEHLESTIVHDIQYQMFCKKVKGGNAYITYNNPEPKVIEVEHTYVPKESRQQGIATNLAKYVLDYAETENFEIIPTCPFFRSYLEHHKEYEELIHEPG